MYNIIITLVLAYYVYVIAHLSGLVNRNIPTKGTVIYSTVTMWFNFALPLSATMTSKKLLRVHRRESLRVLQYSSQCSTTCCLHLDACIPYIASERYNVKVESSEANKGLPQLFSSPKPNKKSCHCGW